MEDDATVEAGETLVFDVVREDEVELDRRAEVVVVPEEEDASNSRTLLFGVSVTQRFPWESNAIPPFRMKPCATVPQLPRLTAVTPMALEVKSDWPITSEADSPLEKAGLSSITLLLPKSATHRFPLESNVAPVGALVLLLVVAKGNFGYEVKSGWPITTEADWPLEKGGEYSSKLHVP